MMQRLREFGIFLIERMKSLLGFLVERIRPYVSTWLSKWHEREIDYHLKYISSTKKLSLLKLLSTWNGSQDLKMSTSGCGACPSPTETDVPDPNPSGTPGIV